jgi:hypothetical protein
VVLERVAEYESEIVGGCSKLPPEKATSVQAHVIAGDKASVRIARHEDARIKGSPVDRLLS